MLVYRGMDIGTDKPSTADLARVRHHLVDCADTGEEYDVARFLREASAAISSSPLPVMGVGGTPYYIHSFMSGLPSSEKGKGLEDALKGLGSAELFRWLSRLDPPRAAALHQNDRFRVIRALSIILSSGRRASGLRPAAAPVAAKSSRIVGLSMDRALLHERLNQRIGLMFERGLLDEARILFGRSMGKTAAAAVGYKELFAHFRGEISLDDAKERILFNTRKLLRKQMIWLRKLPVEWIEISPGSEERACQKILKIAKDFYCGRPRD